MIYPQDMQIYEEDLKQLFQRKERLKETGRKTDPSLAAAIFTVGSKLVKIYNEIAVTYVKLKKPKALQAASVLLKKALALASAKGLGRKANARVRRQQHVLTLNNIACLYCAKVCGGGGGGGGGVGGASRFLLSSAAFSHTPNPGTLEIRN